MKSSWTPINISQGPLRPELQRLLEPGVIGQYEWFEVIEISCCCGNDYWNVFSIYIALEGIFQDAPGKDDFLNRKNRKVDGINGHSFGVQRRYVESKTLVDAMDRFDKEGKWQTSSDKLLLHNELKGTATVFYGPDGTHDVPMNRVLKNNFWNGSHVIELADPAKQSLKFLTSNPKSIAALGTWVRQFVAIDLGAIPDRLGNIVIQLPVTSIAVRFAGTNNNAIGVKVAWHPDAVPRRITGTVQLGFDESIIAYGQRQLNEGDNTLVADTTNRPFQGFVWDMNNNILLAAYPPTIFIGRGTRPNGTWTERRISDVEIQRLVKSKRFVQYGGANRGDDEHQRALADLKELINKHGQHGAYLWDPYLSGTDILNTLFQCQHVKSDLRALTSSDAATKRKNVESIEQTQNTARNQEGLKPEITNREHWIKDQKAVISESIERHHYNNFEFRISFGPNGWHFHDRFLIFPRKSDGELGVWSLGASVNHIGTVHAIIQEVAHPQPVLNAFEELWARVYSSEHVIWMS